MSDSAQVTSPGAINSMIAAMSTRPTRENRSTWSRMLVLIALTPPPPCEPVHMRCAPMRRTSSGRRQAGFAEVGKRHADATTWAP